MAEKQLAYILYEKLCHRHPMYILSGGTLSLILYLLPKLYISPHACFKR